MAEEHNVKGFPTHFMMVDGQKVEDGVGRTYDELMGICYIILIGLNMSFMCSRRFHRRSYTFLDFQRFS